MRRGDVVVVATQGDYGKPRPAVVVQTDALNVERGSVILCQMTSDVQDDIDFRPVIGPDDGNGLRRRSQVMADKLVTVRRDRVGQVVGRLRPDDMRKLDQALVFTLGLGEL